MKTFLFFLTATTLVTAAALPAVGPDYARPTTPSVGQWRDASDALTWKAGVPADTFARGEWWRVFNDATLDDLQHRARAANQDLRAAVARVDEARALAGLARSAFFPSIALTPGVTREETSATTDNVFPQTATTTYRAALGVTWEIDLFGRVRRQRESALAEAEGSTALFESVQLAVAAEVAANYFSLRGLTAEIALVNRGIELRRQTLTLITSRRGLGAATDFDVARAETEVAATEADAAALENRRAALQHALAVLVGESPTDFDVAALASWTPSEPPHIPAGLPSALLERRPDIAAAERALIAANARIGAAKAAFFPAISLTGSGGYASGDIDRLFQTDSRVWSFGPSLYLPIFQGGRNRANLARSKAAYEEAVATYRGQVLVAFREVQDALSANRWLAEQSAAQDRALAAARRAADLAQKRYDSGFVSLLETIDAQRTQLSAERAATQVATQRLNTSIALIKAIGGDWSAPAPVVALNPPR